MHRKKGTFKTLPLKASVGAPCPVPRSPLGFGESDSPDKGCVVQRALRERQRFLLSNPNLPLLPKKRNPQLKVSCTQLCSRTQILLLTLCWDKDTPALGSLAMSELLLQYLFKKKKN